MPTYDAVETHAPKPMVAFCVDGHPTELPVPPRHQHSPELQFVEPDV